MSSKKSARQTSSFVHLHNHTHHSLLDGLQKVPEMVAAAKNMNMPALAITDHGTLSGAIEFYKAAQAEGIKPIIGMETYVASRTHTDKDPSKDKSRYHLIILAMNNEGYENLMRLSSIANLDGFYHKPRIDHELLQKYNAGLIVLSGCIGSEVGENLRFNNDAAAEKAILWYKKVFGDRYYLEVQDHGHQWDEQAKVNDKILKLGKKHGIDVVVTADAHYLSPEDQEAHEVLLCVQTGSFLADQDRMSLKNIDLYLTDPSEIIQRWRDHPEVVSNTRTIADRCEISIELGGILIPKFAVPKGKTEKSYLSDLVYQGLAWRYGKTKAKKPKQLSATAAKKHLSKEILERAQFELAVISSMGFDGYFLIVQDFINWGKDRGIVFGPGRGSAAGSIVAFALNITDLDPLEHDLLFERFLNPDRISMPDIDIDIQDNRRDEVIQYCVEKYGQDRVAHIVTFGTMAARNAIRDVARVLEVPYADADRLAKMVPPPVQGRHIPLEKSIKNNKELREEYDRIEQSKRVFDLAIRLEGTIRSHGVHAAGVVIAPDDIIKYTPLEMSQKGVVATQYPMYPIDELGLLKIDFLGLSNLTIVKNALRIIKKVHQKDIDISAIPLDDKKTYALLGNGDTTGIFQFESGGMKRYLKQLKPDTFDDVIAMGALYRPGPLTAGLTDKYIARKNGAEAISYDHEMMQAALDNTYGVMVYQEQVMQIAKDMCGFTGGQADTLRKAIGKKITTLMNKMKIEFIEGGVKKSGADKKLMEKIWQDIEGFADYAFNKSHSACYGLISYWTAYLKAHYPDAFMAALMTSDYDDTDRLAIEISECRYMGIEVLPPDVNESFVEFGVVPNSQQIRFGMAAIKNVGTGAVEEILQAREAGGKFQSIADFVTRVNTRIVNRKTWESLIKAGAFDSLESRSTLLFNLDNILAYGSKLQKEAESGQTNLFDELDSDSLIASELQFEVSDVQISEREQLQWERELLGLYLTQHPLDGYEHYLQSKTKPLKDLTPAADGKKTTVGGVISTIREITTKNGAKMAFVTIEDMTGEIELIVFPKAFAADEGMWQQDAVIIATGKINTKDRDGNATDELKVLVDEAQLVDESKFDKSAKTPETPKSQPAANDTDQKLYVHVKEPNDNGRLLELKRLLNQYPGSNETVLVLGESDKSAIRLPFKVAATDELQAAIAQIYNPDCVIVK